MKTPEYIKFEAMLEETKRESDRGCALILAANLDNRLRELLCSFFVNVSSGYEKELFEGLFFSFLAAVTFPHVIVIVTMNRQK